LASIRSRKAEYTPDLVEIALVCDHKAYYRKGSYQPKEPLYCFRCEAWKPQGVAA
jgi:hypothetical protein